MSDKDKPTTKPTNKLSEEDTAKVVGGMLPRGATDSEQCKETGDSGTTGCPG